MKCCVTSCKNNSTKTGQGISFHRFPTDQDLRKKWKDKINRPDLVLAKHTVVCSTHFLSGDVIHLASRTVLAPNAVPVLNIKEYTTKQCPTADILIEGKKSNWNIAKTSVFPAEDSVIQLTETVCDETIPRDETNRKIWLKAINQPNLKVDNNTCVCSSHFKKEHLVRSQRKTRLLSAAVPLLNIGFSSDSDDSVDYLSPEELSHNLSDNGHVIETNTCQAAEILVNSKDDAHITEINPCQPNEIFLRLNDHDYVTTRNTCQPAETHASLDENLDHPSPAEQSPDSSDIEFLETNTCKPVEIFVQSENDTINRLQRESVKMKRKLVSKNKIIKNLQQQVRRSRARLVKLEARVKELLIAGR